MRRLGVRAVAARLGELTGHDPEALGEILDRVVHALQDRDGGAAGTAPAPPSP
jgi:hypothetical protein